MFTGNIKHSNAQGIFVVHEGPRVGGVRPDLIVFSASIQEQDSYEIPTATPMFPGSSFPIMLFPKLSDLIDAVNVYVNDSQYGLGPRLLVFFRPQTEHDLDSSV